MRIAGPVDVTIDGQSLDHTIQGVQIRAQDIWKPQYVDSFGRMIYDYIYGGTEVYIILETFDYNLYATLASRAATTDFTAGSLSDIGTIQDHTATAPSHVFAVSMTERDNSSIWAADRCYIAPAWQFQFTSTKPIVYAAVIRVARDASKKFFKTLPGYFRSVS